MNLTVSCSNLFDTMSVYFTIPYLGWYIYMGKTIVRRCPCTSLPAMTSCPLNRDKRGPDMTDSHVHVLCRFLEMGRSLRNGLFESMETIYFRHGLQPIIEQRVIETMESI